MMDEKQHCIYMNPAAEELTGFALNEVQGAPLHDFVHHTRPDGRPYPIEECPIDNAFPENNREQGEDVFIHKDGSFYPVAFTASPIREKGVPVGTIIEVRATTREKELQGERDTILQLTETLFCSINSEGFFVHVNEAFTRLLGWSEAEMTERPFIEFVHPDDVQPTLDIYADMKEGVVVKKFVNRYRRKDGSYRWLMWSTAGEVQNGVGYGLAVDITQQRQQERNDALLSEWSQQAQTPRDPNDVLKQVLTQLGQYLQVNRCAYVDIDPEQNYIVMGPNYVHQTFPIEGRFLYAECDPDAMQRLAQGENYILTDTHQDLESEKFIEEYDQADIRSLVAIPLLQNKQLLACFVVHQKNPRQWTPQEISMLERASKLCWSIVERLQAQQQLKESEAQFRFLAESMPQKIFTTTPTGRIDYLNQEWEKFTGVSPDKKETDWLQFIHPDDLKATMRQWENALNTGEAFQTEHRFKRYDGSYHWHLTRAQPMHGENGEIIMWIGSNTDIDSIKQAKAKLEQAIQSAEKSRRKAEDANQAKSRFLANLSHELRTPLNAIIGFSELMHQENHLNASDQPRIQSIMTNSRHLLGMLNEILELAKIEAGELQLNPVSFALADLLDEIYVMFKEMANLKNIEFRIKVAPELPQYLVLDQLRLQEVLVNLVSNAIKFTEAGEVCLEVRQHSLPETLLFVVQDTGVGIDDNELENLFKPFMQTRSGKISGQGTGLGLSISQEYIHLMGGQLKVESQLKKGSCFRFFLPYKASNSQQAQPKNANAALVLEVTHPYLISVVDDNPDNRKLLCEILTPLGFRVLEAQDGQQALKQAREDDPDLIFMDLSMPHMDGFEATGRIRSAISKSVPIVAVTANAFRENLTQALSVGFNAFVTKPFQRNQLLQVLAEQLGLNYSFEPLEKEEAPNVLPEKLSFPSTAWKDEFEELLYSLDVERIENKLLEIQADHPNFYAKVNHWVQNFAYDDIAHWLEQQYSESQVSH